MFKVTFILLLCAISSSCVSIKSEYIVGTSEHVDIVDLLSELEGPSTWRYGGDIFEVQIEHPKITASNLVWDKSKGKHVIKTSEVVLSMLDKTLFFNIRGKDEKLYTILAASVSSSFGSIVLHSVYEQVINMDIKNGVIEGHKNDYDYILDLSKEQQDEYIKNNIYRLFNYNTNEVITRISEEK